MSEQIGNKGFRLLEMEEVRLIAGGHIRWPGGPTVPRKVLGTEHKTEDNRKTDVAQLALGGVLKVGGEAQIVGGRIRGKEGGTAWSFVILYKRRWRGWYVM